MTCPFLKETPVRYCHSASVRKLIPLATGGRQDDKCFSEEHTSCSVYRAQPQDSETGMCPYLRDSLMHYCGAAPVAKLVPYSESTNSRCGNGGYRYCELYLKMAHPALSANEVDGIALPDWLAYSPGHMWLDISENGVCHAGIDAFLSRALGPIERVSYVWLKGRHRPAAVLTAGGMDFEAVFPNPFMLTNCNLYLRADPQPLTTDPYRSGWLFEGVAEPNTAQGLLRGADAHKWVESEQRRISEFMQAQMLSLGQCSADGGILAPGAALQLGHDGARALFHEFFSPWVGGGPLK